MPSETQALLATAHEALEAGEWSAARSSFEAALDREETAEALLGLGKALWWLEETEASLRCRERAYAEFRRRRDLAQAAMIAVELSVHYGGALGNLAASRGWLSRLVRLVEEFELPHLEGWVLFCRAALAFASDEPRAAERFARAARELARRVGDGRLELSALSQLGGALVELGRVDEGMALLDEAMAASLGGEAGPDTVVHAACRTVTACTRAAELGRAAQWIRAADEFNRRYDHPHLYTTCRVNYGEVMLASGRWSEAEREFETAVERMPKGAELVLRVQALAKLAELRLAQGRIEEAARLLEGLEDHGPAAYAAGLLRLARGELALAALGLRRRLAEVGEGCPERAALLELLSEVEIEQGDTESAMTNARRLADLGARLGGEVIVARGERALGRALAATAQRDRMMTHLERALAAFARLEMPLEAARTRLLLAAALGEDDPAAAIGDGRMALAALEELGASRDADQTAALLRSLGVKAARSGPRGIGILTERELEVLRLLGEGLSNREIAERLFISRKTVEHHVAHVLSKLDLRGRAEAAVYVTRELSGNPPGNR